MLDMERKRSGNSGEFCHELGDSLRFQEEIQSLMSETESAAENGSSFTALLGLPPNQAMQLLHEPDAGDSPAASSPGEGCSVWHLLVDDPKGLAGVPFGSLPAFPSNVDLVERAARLSVFSAGDSPQTSSSIAAKTEPVVSDSNTDSTSPASEPSHRLQKRKETEKSKAKGSTKRSKNCAAEEKKIGEKLPYVHVRARRGQATDSHSLAERARREKINARMKLLQELVPGCSKISGTALVLDEIINHVQSLQRQVEFLSMRLAAMNPRIDFSGLDCFIAADGHGGEQSHSPWPDTPRQHQIWQPDVPSPSPPAPPLWWRAGADQNELRYGSVNSASLRPNQLKQEL